MRLWSIHPCYLDTKGLVALWREGLLAQSVLLGKTGGYRNHPQLIRFKNTADPVGAMAGYLKGVLDEADARGYTFNGNKIVSGIIVVTLSVTSGQVEYEFAHLLEKLRKRAPDLYERLRMVKKIKVHPAFKKVVGAVEDWEMV